MLKPTACLTERSLLKGLAAYRDADSELWSACDVGYRAAACSQDGDPKDTFGDGHVRLIRYEGRFLGSGQIPII